MYHNVKLDVIGELVELFVTRELIQLIPQKERYLIRPPFSSTVPAENPG